MLYYNIFVYGTLQYGCGNEKFLQNGLYLGEAVTRNKYAMYIFPGSNIPFLLKEEISNVYGEYYLVNEITLKNLDILEGEPDLYVREEIEIIDRRFNVRKAFCYFSTDLYDTFFDKNLLLNDGDYKKFMRTYIYEFRKD